MVSVKTDEIAAYDIPVGSLTNTAGMVHIAATGDLDVLVPKGTAVESIALKYNIPSRYKVGERIDPQVELWCGGELVGTFPMEYTVETYAPVEDVPKDDVTMAGSGSVVLTVLKWIGIVLGALIVILFVLRAYFMARRRRRQLTARHLFQVAGHHIHTEQEKGQAQYQPQKRKNIHVFFSFGHPPAYYFIFAYCFIVTHLGESCPVNLPQRIHFPHICAVA